MYRRSFHVSGLCHIPIDTPALWSVTAMSFGKTYIDYDCSLAQDRRRSDIYGHDTYWLAGIGSGHTSK